MFDISKESLLLDETLINQDYYYKINNSYYLDQNAYVFNGKDGKTLPTLNQSKYFHVGDKLTSVQRLQQKSGEVIAYELINPDLASDTIPARFEIDDVGRYFDHDTDIEDWRFINKFFESIRSLYKEVLSDSAQTLVDVDFTINTSQKFEVQNVNRPENISVKTVIENMHGAVRPVNLTSILTYSELADLLVPDCLLHTQECTLSSKQVYGIIRAFVKDNINPAVAVITSDYDFCFTVQRRVKTKPVGRKREKLTGRGNSFKPPRFYTETGTERREKLFEMTYSGYNGTKGYNDYTPIPSWTAPNLQAMIEGIKEYLDELITEINREVQDCPHCEGLGVVHSVIQHPKHS